MSMSSISRCAGALRIDNMERLTNQLNDIEISPTNYMLSFLKQRGWTLPNNTIVIPNVVPDAEKHEASTPAEKKVRYQDITERLMNPLAIPMIIPGSPVLARSRTRFVRDAMAVSPNIPRIPTDCLEAQ